MSILLGIVSGNQWKNGLHNVFCVDRLQLVKFGSALRKHFDLSNIYI